MQKILTLRIFSQGEFFYIFYSKPENLLKLRKLFLCWKFEENAIISLQYRRAF